MGPFDTLDEKQRLENAILAQESLRGVIDDAVIDATIAALREKLAALTALPEQQRKLATILFMDIAGHTALTIDLDPEDQMEVVDAAIARLAAHVDAHGGHVARYQGDGFKAVFGLPVAHENDPAQAVRAGLAIQREAEAVRAELAAERGLEGFQVRVGITTGPVFAGGQTEGEDTIKGPPVNLAARLESAAEPGSVWIAHDCYQHVRGLFDVRPLAPLQARGFAEPVPVYQVLGAKSRPALRQLRGVEGVATRMIGREAETQALLDDLFEVIETRSSRMITIAGDAGLGKSRLLYEFENAVDLLPEAVQVFKGRALLETRHLPYTLLRDLFAFQFRIESEEGTARVGDKLEQGFAEVAGLGATQARIVGQLLGYDFRRELEAEDIRTTPQQLRDLGLRYLLSYFQSVSAEGPVLLLFEDLHWADDSSLDAMLHLGGRLSDGPVLLVATARSEFFERRPDWGAGRANHRRLDLGPLTGPDSRRLVAEVLQKVADLPPGLSELVEATAEGNPYYVEELVKMLIEARVILPGEGEWQVAGFQLKDLQVPTTLTGVLQARLDGLPADERALLQQASVVGRAFWESVLQMLRAAAGAGSPSSDTPKLLSNIRQKELVFRRESSAFAGTHEHIFKHALLRDVTYESVLKRQRQAYHGLVAEWLVENAGDREGEFYGLIADHLLRAGQTEQAVRYLDQAGREAAGRYANDEAVAFFRRALKLLETSSEKGSSEFRDRLIRLHQALGEVLSTVGAYDEGRRSFEQALSLIGPEEKVDGARVIWKIAETWTTQRNIDQALEGYERARNILLPRPESPGDDWWETWLDIQLASTFTLYLSFDVDGLESHLESIREDVQQYGAPSQLIKFFNSLALMHLIRSRWYMLPDEALEHTYKVTTYGEPAALLYGGTLFTGQFTTGFIHLWREELELAEIHLTKALESAEETGATGSQLMALTYLTVVHRMRDDVESAAEFAHRSRDLAELENNPVYLHQSYANLAWAAWKHGDREVVRSLGESSQEFLRKINHPIRYQSDFPLMALEIEENNLERAVDLARDILDPKAKRLPDDLTEQLQRGVAGWDAGDRLGARQSLERALEIAVRTNYF
jgi:class 3 adenylate cyclase